MRLLITGSRDWTDETAMRRAFRAWWRSTRPVDPVLVVGGAKGADSMAETIWRSAGLRVEVHPARWGVHEGCWCRDHSKRCGFAGPRRNQEMVNSGADFCLAFLVEGAENRGTRNCMSLARDAGIPVEEVYQPADN